MDSVKHPQEMKRRQRLAFVKKIGIANRTHLIELHRLKPSGEEFALSRGASTRNRIRSYAPSCIGHYAFRNMCIKDIVRTLGLVRKTSVKDKDTSQRIVIYKMVDPSVAKLNDQEFYDYIKEAEKDYSEYLMRNSNHFMKKGDKKKKKNGNL